MKPDNERCTTCRYMQLCSNSPDIAYCKKHRTPLGATHAARAWCEDWRMLSATSNHALTYEEVLALEDGARRWLEDRSYHALSGWYVKSGRFIESESIKMGFVAPIAMLELCGYTYRVWSDGEPTKEESYYELWRL